jgi:hypothetical protein
MGAPVVVAADQRKQLFRNKPCAHFDRNERSGSGMVRKPNLVAGESWLFF